MARIVIALGGNALGNDYLQQQKLLKSNALKLIKLFKGNEVVITHGNGPQVGMITKALASSSVDMPLDCCTAMSEGYIGYHIQKELKRALSSLGIKRDVITVVSEVTVDKKDPSFLSPTKPIGKFYTKEEADELAKESGDTYVEDAGRGYRKVVASPKPLNISGLKAIKDLLKGKNIVVACGGGGVPVFDDKTSTKVDAVIDKDLASSLLAQKLHADLFIILTAVNQVKIHFGEKNEENLSELTIKDAKKYLEANEFKSGSMKPKVEAAISFTKQTGNPTIITSLKNIEGILKKEKITKIVK